MKNERCQKVFNRHYNIAFWVTLVVALSLIIGGFFVPPTGEVDGSLLTATGELFLWPALALGAKSVEDGRVARIKFRNASLNIGQDKNHDGFDDNWQQSIAEEDIEN